jgi:carboxymethylenebutenolidase
MIVTTESVVLPLPGPPMRTLVTAPKAAGRYPSIWCYSDIFQLTPPLVRACVRLAGYGFVAAAPEIYRRIEPPGTVLPFDDAGRTRGLEDASRMPVADFDADCRAGLDWLAGHPKVSPGRLGAMGFCIGGHLAFRAAFQPEIRATACFYPTGLHDGRLGRDPDAGSLARARDIGGELLLVFGTQDPHVPAAARETIERALRDSGVRFRLSLYEAEHAFMRDEGPRYDPEATDLAFGEMIAMFRRVFAH